MSNVYDYYYENYLMLYSLYGRGRPRVNRERYEELDQELLGIMSSSEEQGLNHDSASRIGEIEYLLLDDVAESLLGERDPSARMVEPAPSHDTSPIPKPRDTAKVREVASLDLSKQGGKKNS